MKTISIESLCTGEIFEVAISKGTKTLNILEFLGLGGCQLVQKMEGGGCKVFDGDEVIYEKVTEQNELILLPKAEINPPVHPEKNIIVVEAGNGWVHQVSIKQGDTLEGMVERWDLGSGLLYNKDASVSILSNLSNPFEEVQEGETLTFFGLSECPTSLQNYLNGGD